MLNKLNTTMKKIILMFAAVVMAAGVMSAQDINAVTEIYNNGAMELQMENKEAALENFQNALKMAIELGDEGMEIADNCRTTIPALVLSIAKDLIKAQSYDPAIEKLNAAIAAAEEYSNTDVIADAKELISQVTMLKGNELIKAKNFAAAIPVFEELIAADSTNANAAIRLGMAYMSTNKTAEAEKAYLLAARHGEEAQANKQLSNMFVKVAAADLKAKKYADAIANADKSNAYLENATAMKVAGTAASQLKKNAEAITYLEKYLELSPNAKDAANMKYTIAATAQAMGNNAKAKEYYQQIVNDPKLGATVKPILDALK